MAKRMSAKTARNSFSDLLGIVYYSKEAVIVEKRGRPVAAVISMEDYAQLLDAREERLKVFDEIRAMNQDVAPEEAQEDADREIAALRSETSIRSGKD